MKDHETLTTHHIKDGHTVHLVIKMNTRAGDATGGTGTGSNNTTPTRPPGMVSYLINKEFYKFIKSQIIVTYLHWIIH